MKLFAIALGGALGALSRHGLTSLVEHHVHTTLPVGTLSVNALGSFCAGLLAGLFLERWDAGIALRNGLLIGYLGAFTTFSTFSYQTLVLLREEGPARALMNVGLSLLLSLVAVWAGFSLVARH